MALSHANTILSWQENMMRDEIPPEWMWSLDHELVIWFERMEEARENKYSGGGDGEMVKNELARGRG